MSFAIPPSDIRCPVPSDAMKLAECFRQLVEGGVPSLPPEALASYLIPWNEELLHKRIVAGNDLLLAAWQGNRIAGIVSGTVPEGGVGTVIWLLVAKELQGHGIGRALFTEACRHYRTAGAHKLKLTAPTEEAVKFYEAVGMKREGFHPRHWWKADFWSLGMAL